MAAADEARKSNAIARHFFMTRSLCGVTVARNQPGWNRGVSPARGVSCGASVTARRRRIARRADQRRRDDERILAAALERVILAVGHDHERAGADRRRFLFDSNRTLAGH